MAYFRTIVKGNWAGVEAWSCSINWGVFGISPDTPDQAAVDGMLANLKTFMTSANLPANIKLLMSTGCQITAFRVEKRGEDEHILSVAEGSLTTAVNGTNPASKTPQDALVISLRTNTPGARGRGRLYWPATGATLSAAFALTTPTPAQIATDMKTLISGFGTQLNNYFIGISSALRVVLSVRSVSSHVNHDVVSLQVGSILDTQRRRRDTLLETYSSIAYP